MKRISVAAMFVGTVVLLAGGTASAAEQTAKISLYHLNSAISGRGVCVQTQPAMPNTWACLWKSNPLYTEISTLLLQAYLTNRTCTISWNGPDPSGWNLISIVECRK